VTNDAPGDAPVPHLGQPGLQEPGSGAAPASSGPHPTRHGPGIRGPGALLASSTPRAPLVAARRPAVLPAGRTGVLTAPPRATENDSSPVAIAALAGLVLSWLSAGLLALAGLWLTLPLDAILP
jgi:hypothetical protein